MTPSPPIDDPAVGAAFDRHPGDVREALLSLRRLILDTAGSLPEVGPVVETLKWGQPSYLPKKPRVGTTLRVDGLKNAPTGYALFFHCQSTLGETFRAYYGDTLTIVGDRSVVLDTRESIPRDALRHCIALALTYHLRNRP